MGASIAAGPIIADGDAAKSCCPSVRGKLCAVTKHANFGVVIARTPGGVRFICRAGGADTVTIAFLASGGHEPVGVWGEAMQAGDGVDSWRCK